MNERLTEKTMSRKDFEMIARVVRYFRSRNLVIPGLGEAFADELVKTNPRFDRQRFLDACEVDND